MSNKKWTVRPSLLHGTYQIVEGQKPVADVVGTGDEARQRAKLLAAAPELLAALERLLGDWEDAVDREPSYMPIADHAREAIRRAQQ